MKEENTNTKERIQEEALKLFAQLGYKSVSIRDISKQVGIKESSIYYHYKNKQAILDAIIEQAEAITYQLEERFNHAFSKTCQLEEDAFCQVAVAFFEGYLLNPYVYSLLMMLSIERLSDIKSAKVYQKMMFELPLEKQTQIFAEMMEKGLIQKGDARSLAYAYYSIIYLAFEKNCMGMEKNKGDREQAVREIEIGILNLFRKMR